LQSKVVESLKIVGEEAVVNKKNDDIGIFERMFRLLVKTVKAV